MLSLEDDDVEDDEVEDEEDNFDDVGCSLALLRVEFVVELVPEMVEFAVLPVPVVEFVLEPVMVELLGGPAAPVELLLDLDPGATMGVIPPLFELEEAVEEGEETVADGVEDVAVELDARAATASVGQVEHPPKSWSIPE